MKSVCFVCLGNICRSPMAEFLMKAIAEKDGFPLLVESRGTSNWEHGNPIHSGTQKVLTSHGINYNRDKSSQQINYQELSHFDWIIAMDESNLADLKSLSDGVFDAKIALFCPNGVADPWYTGDFESTYDVISQGCRDWLTIFKREEIVD